MSKGEVLSTKGVFSLDDVREEFIGEFGSPAMSPPTNGDGIDYNGAQGEQ